MVNRLTKKQLLEKVGAVSFPVGDTPFLEKVAACAILDATCIDAGISSPYKQTLEFVKVAAAKGFPEDEINKYM